MKPRDGSCERENLVRKTRDFAPWLILSKASSFQEHPSSVFITNRSEKWMWNDIQQIKAINANFEFQFDLIQVIRFTNSRVKTIYGLILWYGYGLGSFLINYWVWITHLFFWTIQNTKEIENVKMMSILWIENLKLNNI